MVIRRLFKALWVVLGTVAILICLLNIAFYQVGKTTDVFATRWDGRLWNPPRCVVNAKAVRIGFAPTEILWQHGVSLGTLVTSPDGEPVMVLDATHYERMPSELQRFIIFHECAHARLGHFMGDGIGAEAEKAADCEAMWDARREGWTRERYEALFAAIVDPELMIPATEGVAFVEERARAHAWTPQERVDHAKSCITLP